MKKPAVRRWWAWLLPALALLLLLLAVPLVLAQEDEVLLRGELHGDQYAGGGMVVVQDGALIHGDVLAAGERIIVEPGAVIQGDLLAFGNTVIVHGRVEGSVMVGANRVEIHGPVGHAVRIFGGGDFPWGGTRGGLVFSGRVDGDLLAWGGTVEVLPGARVGRDAYTYGYTVMLAGDVARDVQAGGNKVRLLGHVGRDTVLSCGDPCEIGRGAALEGSLTYTSERPAEIDGIVRGPMAHLLPESEAHISPGRRLAQTSWGWVRAVLAAVAVGAIILWLTPKGTAAVEEALRCRPGYSVGWGAILLFGLPLALLIVFILSAIVRLFPVVLPLSLLLLAIYAIAWYVSQVFVGYTIGRLIFKALRWDSVRGARFWMMILGIVLLSLLWAVPFLGGWLAFVSLLFGLGAIAVAWWRSRRGPEPEAVSEDQMAVTG